MSERAKLKMDTYKQRFGARLRELRDKSKQSQKDVAEKLGVHPTTVADWEKAKKASPKFDMLPDIAKALGCTIRELFPEE